MSPWRVIRSVSELGFKSQPFSHLPAQVGGLLWSCVEEQFSFLLSQFLLQVIIHKLLSMFHPRPFVKTRFAPQGAVACIQASSSFYYTIAFR